jgi:hypothetical protein
MTEPTPYDQAMAELDEIDRQQGLDLVAVSVTPGYTRTRHTDFQLIFAGTCGFFGLVFEVLMRTHERPALVALFAALMAFPAFMDRP